MKILCSFPGKHGDLLWALPTIRAIGETYGVPVDLMISPPIAGLQPLLEKQTYIRAVHICSEWRLLDTAPVTPRKPPCVVKTEGSYERIVHLGYRAWPDPDCARHTYETAQQSCDRPLAPHDLNRPWLIPPYELPHHDLAIGFTDEHFELKYGVRGLLVQRFPSYCEVSTSPRWLAEAGVYGSNWATAAAWIRSARVFLGCCSALHVLACAVGTPAVLMEPNPQRHATVFYPYGKTGRVRLVTGNDGQPTFDARAVRHAIQEALDVAVSTRLEPRDAPSV